VVLCGWIFCFVGVGEKGKEKNNGGGGGGGGGGETITFRYHQGLS